jgi:DNA-binding FadR family transcriptional regulator
MLAEYGVSRGSLREALRILELHGIIAIKAGPGGGPVVTAADAADFGRMTSLHFQASGVTFGELAEARLAIEPLIARLAAANRDDEGAARMAELAAAEGDGEHDGLAASLEFHELLGALAGNGALALLAGSFREIFRRYVAAAVLQQDYGTIEELHAEIAAAVAAGDPDAAEAAMRRHIQLIVDEFRRREPRLAGAVVNWL